MYMYLKQTAFVSNPRSVLHTMSQTKKRAQITLKVEDMFNAQVQIHMQLNNESGGQMRLTEPPWYPINLPLR